MQPPYPYQSSLLNNMYQPTYTQPIQTFTNTTQPEPSSNIIATQPQSTQPVTIPTVKITKGKGPEILGGSSSEGGKSGGGGGGGGENQNNPSLNPNVQAIIQALAGL